MMMDHSTRHKIAYYVSGHGFGHSTRACAVIHQLLKHGNSISIITSAPQFIFQEVIDQFPETCIYRSVSFESGVNQKDAVTVDREKTMLHLEKFMGGQLTEILDQEETWMKNWIPHFVCSDAAFVPLIIAKKLSIPSALVTNFTFDEIYEDLVSNDRERQLVEDCKKLYFNAEYLIRLPGHINIPAFTSECFLRKYIHEIHPNTNMNEINKFTLQRNSRIFDVPLVVRKSRADRNMTRSLLSISPHQPVVLITFGGHELSQLGKKWKDAQSILPPGWTGIIIAPGKELDVGSSPSSPNSADKTCGELVSKLVTVKSEDWYMPDLIEASDVVLSKCGYGMCSEVVAHRKPLIYVPRNNFVEEKGLLKNLMGPYGHALEMSKDQFYKGEWSEFIQEAFKLVDVPTKNVISSDGDLVACQKIMDLLQITLRDPFSRIH